MHNDPPAKITATGFDRFLCSDPFPESTVSDSTPSSDGAFHALYRLDGRLIAFAVLDVLPDCLSSVYFVWDPDFAALGLGKVGALRELAAAQGMGLQHYYMGASSSRLHRTARGLSSATQASTSTHASRCDTRASTAQASSQTRCVSSNPCDRPRLT